MRIWIAFVLVTALAACGTDKGPGGGGGGGGMDGGPSGAAAIDVQSADITLAPGQEVTYCWYFHTSNTAPAAIDKWVSDMTPGSHHLILFIGGASHADGLDMTNSCGLGTGSVSNPPVWVYSAQTAHQEEDLPGDDGTGKPLAQMIQPNSEAAIQMHYLNASDSTIMAHVHVQGFALPTSTAFTQTDAYITYNADISIPPNATGVQVTASCPLPAGKLFWTMSTHAHKQAVHTQVMDGTSTIFQSDDWEHPGQQTWSTTPFYTFTQPNLTWECVYDNTGDNHNNTVVQGPSASTNEMCMAVGYFFPSTGPHFEVQYNGQCYGL